MCLPGCQWQKNFNGNKFLSQCSGVGSFKFYSFAIMSCVAHELLEQLQHHEEKLFLHAEQKSLKVWTQPLIWTLEFRKCFHS
jgi:hypothetical protein